MVARWRSSDRHRDICCQSLQYCNSLLRLCWSLIVVLVKLGDYIRVQEWRGLNYHKNFQRGIRHEHRKVR